MESGKISVLVTNSSSEFLKEVHVRLNSESYSSELQTDPSGECSFIDIPMPNSYTLRAEMAGYQTEETAEIPMPPHSDLTLNITLLREDEAS